MGIQIFDGVHPALNKARKSGCYVVSLSGDVDLTATPELATLETKLQEPDCVVFDVAGVNYADTTFLRFLLRLKTHANKSGRAAIRLIGVKRNLQRLLEVTGLSRVFAYETA